MPKIRLSVLGSIFALGLFIWCVASVPAAAQTATPPKADIDKVERLFKGSSVKYLRGDGVWIVKGENDDFIFSTGEGTLVGFVTVAPKDKIKLSMEALTEILKIQDEADSVRFAIGENGNLRLVLDERLRLVDQKEFDFLVNQLIAVSDLAKKRLQPYFVK